MEDFTTIYLIEQIEEPSSFYRVFERAVGAEISEGLDFVNIYTRDEAKVERARQFLREAGFTLLEDIEP